jgi:hypothetical protein
MYTAKQCIRSAVEFVLSAAQIRAQCLINYLLDRGALLGKKVFSPLLAQKEKLRLNCGSSLFLALGRRFAIDAADNSQVMMVELGGNAKFLLLNKLHRRGFSFAEQRLRVCSMRECF